MEARGENSPKVQRDSLMLMKDRSPENPIDAVITWVDGDDPKHQAKMNAVLQGKSRNHIPGAEKTRFGNANELQYSVLSIFKFAPFIRKVFIVTDEQHPDILRAIEKYFPERIKDVQIVDHREIFIGFEKYLPTFNSRSIEAMLWRIHGISDQFIFLSDDMFLIKPLKPEDLFLQNKPVMRGTWLFRPVLRNFWDKLRIKLQHGLLNHKEFQPKPSFHLGQWNAAEILGFKSRYFFSSHTPHTVNRIRAASYFKENPEVLKNQIKHRFRHFSQFNCAAFYYHLEILSGNKNFRSPSFVFMHPHGRYSGYIDKKLKKCETDPSALFLNIQSLELCSQDEQERIISWLEKKLQPSTISK